jgi:hypothetical protein
MWPHAARTPDSTDTFSSKRDTLWAHQLSSGVLFCIQWCSRSASGGNRWERLTHHGCFVATPKCGRSKAVRCSQCSAASWIDTADSPGNNCCADGTVGATTVAGFCRNIYIYNICIYNVRPNGVNCRYPHTHSPIQQFVQTKSVQIDRSDKTLHPAFEYHP